METVDQAIVAETLAGCECAECAEHGGPSPTIMAVRLFFLAAQFLVAVMGLLKERSWKALGVFLGAIAFFFTLPRYLICARCDGYGKNCYSLYLGKITSLYLPRVEGKEVNPSGAGLEMLTLQTISLAPAIGLRKNRRLLSLYLLLSNITSGLHFLHACRHCAEYATDWRKDCPSARIARRIFAGG